MSENKDDIVGLGKQLAEEENDMNLDKAKVWLAYNPGFMTRVFSTEALAKAWVVEYDYPPQDSEFPHWGVTEVDVDEDDE